MSLIYRVLYAVGFAPWDDERIPDELRSLVEGPDALPAGRALDLGCGTGAQCVYLARAGWQVTGVDAVPKPLRRARERVRAEHVDVRLLQGDVTKLTALGLDGPFSLLYDRGCFHGLSDAQRVAYVDGVTAVSAPQATLLMMAFARNQVKVGPAGVDTEELAALFAPAWEIAPAVADEGPAPSGPLSNVPRSWYRIRRRSDQ